MKTSTTRASPNAPALYDEDFFLWTRRTAEILRSGNFEELDCAHVAEEVEDLGKGDLRELNSRVQVLVMHLLKWLLQPDKRSPSWQSTIVTQRLETEAVLEQSPSLHGTLQRELARNYIRAVKRALPETGLRREQFPAECPFTLRQILDEEFLPESR